MPPACLRHVHDFVLLFGASRSASRRAKRARSVFAAHRGEASGIGRIRRVLRIRQIIAAFGRKSMAVPRGSTLALRMRIALSVVVVSVGGEGWRGGGWDLVDGTVDQFDR